MSGPAGLDRAPVAGLQSYLSLSSGKSLFNRFWFAAKYDPLLVSEDGHKIEIQGQGQGLQLLASNTPDGVDAMNPAAKKFADDFTAGFPKLEEAIPAFADLHNVADLAVVAAIIAEDRLYEKASWDPGWILQPGGYRPVTVEVPRQAETLVNTSTKGRRTVTCVGGVQLALQDIVKKRQRMREAASQAAAAKQVESSTQPPVIPPGSWSVRVQPVARAR